MRQLYTRSRKLKRLLSVTLGRRSREEESTEEDGSSVRAARPMVFIKVCLFWDSRSVSMGIACQNFILCLLLPDFVGADNLVGRGGHAEVYRGVTADGQAVAVKRLMRASTDEQREKDFLTELGTVGHVRHPNVSALLGCCIDRDLHLIFEFSSRGSVSSNLHGSKLNELGRLAWPQRRMRRWTYLCSLCVLQTRTRPPWIGSCGTASPSAPPGGFITSTRGAREGSSTETSRPPTYSSHPISNLRYRS
ncbi:hypothetical protein B296_00022826 [Ensete ventricosum]|uniref:Protein kinase domain-containing protein n=1 Tax=Ensete ventricosum TaxID=4639 RepID=A0A426ZFJ5_ENSVE|nr:hypothetical protein B296_00022826 [Ensete ventricosum]